MAGLGWLGAGGLLGWAAGWAGAGLGWAGLLAGLGSLGVGVKLSREGLLTLARWPGWAAGLLGCWAAGLLGCWAAGLAAVSWLGWD